MSGKRLVAGLAFFLVTYPATFARAQFWTGFVQGFMQQSMNMTIAETRRAQQELMRQQAEYYRALAEAERSKPYRSEETIRLAWNRGYEMAIEQVKGVLPKILDEHAQGIMEGYARAILTEQQPGKLHEYRRAVTDLLAQAPDRYGNQALLVLIDHRLRQVGSTGPGETGAQAPPTSGPPLAMVPAPLPPSVERQVPQPPTLQGTYAGRIVGRASGRDFTMNITLRLVQSGNEVTGTWVATGRVSGSMRGTTVRANLLELGVRQTSPCVGEFSGTADIEDGGVILRGSYSGKDCGGMVSASFLVKRE